MIESERFRNKISKIKGISGFYKIDIGEIPDISSYECNPYIPLIFYNPRTTVREVYYGGYYKRFMGRTRLLALIKGNLLQRLNFLKGGHPDLTLVTGGSSIFIETDQTLSPLVLQCVDKKSLFNSTRYTYVVNRPLLESLSSHFYYPRLKSIIKDLAKSSDIVFTSDIKRLCFSFTPRVEHRTVSELIDGLNFITEQTLEKRFPTIVVDESSTESQNFEDNIIIEEFTEGSLEETVINLREQTTAILTSEEAVQHINVPQDNYVI